MWNQRDWALVPRFRGLQGRTNRATMCPEISRYVNYVTISNKDPMPLCQGFTELNQAGLGCGYASYCSWNK